jgi:hypothetical protein
MDSDPGGCGGAYAGRATAWPDGWFAKQAPDWRQARTGLSSPSVEAIVHRGQIRVRSVRGWREASGEQGPAGKPGSLGRLPPHPAPWEACERAEEAVRIRAALATLPGRYRQALHLVYVEGHTHGEAAIHLAIPIGTAKAWVRRGLRALRLAHASLATTPIPGVAVSTRVLAELQLESRRSPRPTREVSLTTG